MHPPPNITGSLTIGHCLQLSLEDTLVRWHRMRGFNTLFQPGYDHAGISTWAAIGRQLAKEGKTPARARPRGFDAYVREWLERYGGTIMSQFRLLGASLDYRRTRFTMDDGYYRAVMRWFVHLYERGWIYRANRIVNWCPRDRTSLSDLEVEHEDIDDTLSYIHYPLADGSGHVTIATVRPATILADVAVAVHPDDERYRDLVGKEVVVPFVERRVPVIADERVEPEFGTGALKVTPGHDPTDFEIGRDHGLPELTVIGPDGLMNDAAGELAGLTQEEAAKRVLDWAAERGQLEKRESYRHSVGHCERCHSRIEPLVLLAVVVAMEELAAPAIAAVEEGRVRFTPERFARVYLDWMENVRDWNISRQIWWGHQIPVWYCPDGHVTVAETEPDACAECGSAELRQEEDVLDTWFSSALWPFATLGWPDETPELARYYPGNVLTTARDIIFLWIARMIFSGLELIGDDPFHDVRHPLDARSIPTGSGCRRRTAPASTPRTLLEPYGADATRYGLLKMTSSQDPRFSFGTIEEGRKLANKLWNASRLLLHGRRRRAGGAARRRSRSAGSSRASTRRAPSSRPTSRGFDFAHAVERLYHLTFDDFCDWYLESIKPRLGGGGRAGDGVRGARAAAQAAPSGDAARDRGDLDEPAGARDAADRRAVAGAATEYDGRPGRARRGADGGADLPAQRRADRARRRLRCGSSRRSSVPRTTGRATSRPSARGCSKEIERSREDAREREVRRERRARGRRGRAREARAIPCRARRAGLSPLSPVAGGRLRDGADARAAARARRPAGAVPGDPRRRHERQVDDDAADGGAAARRGALGRRVPLAARARLERADPDRRRGGGLRGRGGRVRPAAEALGATQFEALTAAALLAFAAADVDVAVVEAGLGGRHDATNVLDTRVVVLTNVALDHMDVLGDTREAIAAEKLAVVQPGCTVVLSEQEWRELAAENGAATVVLTGRSNLALAIAAAESFLGRRSTRTPPTASSCRAGSSAAASTRSRSGTAPTTSPASAGCCRGSRRLAAAGPSSARSSATSGPG